MDVYWLEQSEANLPAENNWLSESEVARLNGMRFAKRRADWRLGRWTAKRALVAYLNLAYSPSVLAGMEIRSAPSGAPEVILAGRAGFAAISLSHRAGRGLCAVAPFGAVLGCDLEVIEARSGAFVTDYFTSEEQALVEQAPPADRSPLETLIWSAKESALKALGAGLRLDTRSVSVNLAREFGQRSKNGEGVVEDPLSAAKPEGDLHCWHPLQVRHADGRIFNGWWQCVAEFVQTVVAVPRPDRPILLRFPSKNDPRGDSIVPLGADRA